MSAVREYAAEPKEAPKSCSECSYFESVFMAGQAHDGQFCTHEDHPNSSPHYLHHIPESGVSDECPLKKENTNV